MRITQRSVMTTSLAGLNSNLAAVNKLQQQLTSGKTISTPSDSPTLTNRSLQTRADMSALTQQSRNINDATAWLETADSTLGNMLDLVHRARDLTVQGLNSGAGSAASAESIATEIASIRESLLGLANTKVQGRPLFGGVTPGTSAYDRTTGAYVGLPATGAPVPVERRLSNVETIRVDITGLEVFGRAPDDLFGIIGRIATGVTDLGASGNAALRDDLVALDGAITSMLTGIADIGARASRVERADQINLERSLTLKAQLSSIEDVDLPRTIMELQMQQTGYEAALSATAKAIQPSLQDFLH
jgi:flagellar hook-associated protein 3 FlgL